MKALYYTATRETAFRNSPDPVAKAGEALMAVEAVGICGSDMHAWHGHDPRRVPPMILGHEAAGRVLKGPLAGQRVVVNPLISCGLCQYCSGGRSNLCPERELVGMRIPGAFAERLTLPARNLIPVPEGMDAAKAALTAASRKPEPGDRRRFGWPLGSARSTGIRRRLGKAGRDQRPAARDRQHGRHRGLRPKR